MPGWGWPLLGLALLGVLGVVVDRLLLAAEVRGWLYYRRRAPSRTAVGNAMMSILEIYEPQQHHTVEERRQYDADEATDDDPYDRS